MNRLTKKYKNGIITLDADKFPGVGQETLDREIGAFAPFRRAVEVLCEYEDAEENGTLVRLPCKVGDTVYYTHYAIDENIKFLHVKTISIHDDGDIKIHYKSLSGGTGYVFRHYFGKTVFLTREKAEAALKARENK